MKATITLFSFIVFLLIGNKQETLVEINDIESSLQDEYVLDRGHSFITFKAVRFGISTVFGTFDSITGSLKTKDGYGAQINIQSNSINSNLKMRDDQLKGEMFLNTAKHPVIVVKLKRIEQQNSNNIAFVDITLLNVKKSYEVPVDLVQTVKDPTGKSTIALNGDLTIDRMDFGMKMNKLLPTGLPMIGNEVDLSFSFLFEKK